jgi:hypothetical protein
LARASRPLGIEVIALRRLVPRVGSAITVTASTIALFLLRRAHPKRL